MGILKANLKQYYQRRILMIFYVYLAGMTGAVATGMWETFSDNFGNFWICLHLALTLILGFLSGNIQLDLARKSVLFCLPGYRKSVPKFLLVPGIVFNLLFAIGYLVLADTGSLAGQGLMFLSAFSLGLCLWMFAALVVLIGNAQIIWSAIILLIVIVFMYFRYSLFILIERVPLITIAMSWAGLLLMKFANWPRMLRNAACSSKVNSILSSWNTKEVQQAKLAKLYSQEEGRTERRLANYFIGLISRAQDSNAIKYIAGDIYQTLGLTWIWMKKQYWIAVILIPLISAWFSLFAFASHGSIVPCVIAGMMFSRSGLRLFSPRTICGARNHRFICTCCLTVLYSLMAAAIMSLIISLTWLCSTLLPEIKLGFLKLQFHPISFKVFYLPSVAIVFCYIGRILFRERIISVMVWCIGVMGGLGGISAFFIMSNMNLHMALLQILTIGWLIYLLVLRRVCLRGDLVADR